MSDKELGAVPDARRKHIEAFAWSVMASAATATAIALIWLVVMAINEDAVGAEPGDYFNRSTLLLPPIFLLIAFVGALIGLPLSWYLSRQKMEGTAIYPMTGFIVGALPMIWLMIIKDHSHMPILFAVAAILSGGLPGAVWGYVWWRMARRPHGNVESAKPTGRS